MSIIPETGKVLGWGSGPELVNITVDSSTVALPGNGRTVTTLTNYLANNAVFNVRDYGAVGNGVTDDLAAFTACAAAAIAAGGIIYIPPANVGKCYRLTDSWVFANKANVRIRGEGVYSLLCIESTPAVSITSITRSGSTATATTPVAHGLATGDAVAIAGAAQTEYNGNFIVTVTSSTTFTYTVGGTPATPATGTIVFFRAVSSMSITRSGGTATATTPVAHGLATGDAVTIAGAAQTEYNGNFTVTVTGSTTFTYAVSGTPATPATGTIVFFRARNAITFSACTKPHVQGIGITGKKGSGHGIELKGSSNRPQIVDVWIGWVDGDCIRQTKAISAIYDRVWCDENNGFDPADLGNGVRGDSDNGLYITGDSGLGINNNACCYGCHLETSGHNGGVSLKVGDDSGAVDSFAWFGGLIQGNGNHTLVRLRTRDALIEGAHIEPPAEVSANYVVTVDRCSQTVIKNGGIAGDVQFLGACTKCGVEGARSSGYDVSVDSVDCFLRDLEVRNITSGPAGGYIRDKGRGTMIRNVKSAANESAGYGYRQTSRVIYATTGNDWNSVDAAPSGQKMARHPHRARASVAVEWREVIVAVEDFCPDREVALDTSAAPSLGDKGYQMPQYTVGASATSITGFIGATVGKPFTLLFTGARTVVASATMRLSGSVNFVGKANDTLTLVLGSDGLFREVGRCVT